jgi:hypothetical protein
MWGMFQILTRLAANCYVKGVFTAASMKEICAVIGSALPGVGRCQWENGGQESEEGEDE